MSVPPIKYSSTPYLVNRWIDPPKINGSHRFHWPSPVRKLTREMKSGFQIVYATCQSLYRFAAHPPETAFAHKWCGKKHLPLFPLVTHLPYKMTSVIKIIKIPPPHFTLPNKTKNSCLFHYSARTERIHPPRRKFEFQIYEVCQPLPRLRKLQSSIQEILHLIQYLFNHCSNTLVWLIFTWLCSKTLCNLAAPPEASVNQFEHGLPPKNHSRFTP